MGANAGPQELGAHSDREIGILSLASFPFWLAGLPLMLGQMIDCDTGGILPGEESIEQAGERILEQVIATASNRPPCKAEILGQDDFAPWKRGLTF